MDANEQDEKSKRAANEACVRRQVEAIAAYLRVNVWTKQQGAGEKENRIEAGEPPFVPGILGEVRRG